MLYSYAACIKKFGTDYKLKKALCNEELFQIEKGIYSDRKRISELGLITFKYPFAIFTLESAFYYHGLTDTIPDLYVMNTDRNAPKIKDKRVKQYFCEEKLLGIGRTMLNYQDIQIPIYNLERLIIELVRYRNKLPYDYYKEVVRSLRNRINTMDLEKLQGYIPLFPVKGKIQNIIAEEIF